MSDSNDQPSRPASSLHESTTRGEAPAPPPPQAGDLLPSADKGNQMNAGVPLLFIGLVLVAIVVYGAIVN